MAYRSRDIEAIVAGEKPAAQEAEIGVGEEEGKKKRGKKQEVEWSYNPQSPPLPRDVSSSKTLPSKVQNVQTASPWGSRGQMSLRDVFIQSTKAIEGSLRISMGRRLRKVSADLER